MHTPDDVDVVRIPSAVIMRGRLKAYHKSGPGRVLKRDAAAGRFVKRTAKAAKKRAGAAAKKRR